MVWFAGWTDDWLFLIEQPWKHSPMGLTRPNQQLSRSLACDFDHSPRTDDIIYATITVVVLSEHAHPDIRAGSWTN